MTVKIGTAPHLKLKVLYDLSLILSTLGEGIPAQDMWAVTGCAALWQGKRSLLKHRPAAAHNVSPLPTTLPLSNATNSLPTERITTDLGQAERSKYQVDFTVYKGGIVRQTLVVDQYINWPEAVFLQWEFKNLDSQDLTFDRVSCPTLELVNGLQARLPSQRPWTFQGAAVQWGQDFAFRMPARYRRDNFLGHVQHGEGGGIPLAYCWNRTTGIALAHIEPKPLECYLPVKSDPRTGISMRMEQRQAILLKPGETFTSWRVMVSVHSGDFFAPLALYREVMDLLGLKPAATDPEDYEPAWCSWGYEFDVRPEEMTGVFPAVNELGIHWLTLDDRWFDHYGDWKPRPDTFPGGEAQMRQMVAEIQRAGMYAQIWWYPLAVEDGSLGYAHQAHENSEILSQHPDWILLNEDLSPARNNRSLAMLCPALPEVQADTARLVRLFIQDWGFDGHKLDNIYTVPPCYNPAHHHQRPQESVEALSEIYRLIFETTRTLKPHSITQICPCGTPPTFSLLPFMDQAVTADPTSSAQIRQRTKFYKAILGPRAAVFSDHVELSDGGSDFASGIGTGGIPSTKFVWPENPAVRQRLQEYHPLTPRKEALWKKWFSLYQRYRISEGEYMNLYDLGHDLPESHAIRKDGRLYFAFYAGKLDQVYQGRVTLRGLGEGNYLLRDYVNDQSLGTVKGPEVFLEVEFRGSLLVEAVPV